VGADLTDLLARAEAAAALVGQDPAEAYRLAADTAGAARQARDWEAAAVALRAAARAASWQGRPDEASARIRDALRAARRPGAIARLPEVHTTAAHLWFLQGRRARAFSALETADALATGEQRLKVAAQRAVLLWHMGRHGESEALLRNLLERAEGELRADAFVNLGGVLAEQGRFDEAEVVLRDAAAGYDALGLAHDAAAVALHNLALLNADAGRIPAALDVFDDVEHRLTALAAPLSWLLVGRVQVLLAANLVNEALETAERAVDGLEPTAPLDLRAAAWWRLAQARLRAGDGAGAAAAAEMTARLFRRMASAGGAAMANRLALRARSGRGDTRTRLGQARAMVDELARSGLVVDALEARLDVVRLAGPLGELDVLASQLGPLRAARRRGPALVRARAWYGEALILTHLGDGAGARRALDQALLLLDEHRASLGSTELRAVASGHGAEMAGLAVRLAVERRKPAAVLRSAEKWRAGSLWRRPVVPRELAAELAALRRVRSERDVAALAGEDVAVLLRREDQLEASVRRISRRAAGGSAGDATSVARLELGHVHAALGPRALVEIVEHAGQLHAVVVAAGRCSLHELGSSAAVADELSALGFALRRLGRARGTGASGGGAAAITAGRQSAEHGLARLDERLLGPLRRRIDTRPLVIVPTGALHAVPWPALPSVAGRAVTVVPSAAWWADRSLGDGAASPAPSAASVTLVAGPGLPGARAEVAELAARYAGAQVLTGEQATTEAVSAALDGTALAHLACHGRFRADNPLFSALELADGALTVYDLEQLSRAPDRVVLSACDSGVSAVRPGDELLGLLSSLFALGTTTVIASVVPVPDLDTRRLMVALHDRLRAGRPAAEALQEAAAALDPTEPTAFVTRSAFVCFGTGA
jgi:tetratricopeptide (TPR) repeat protein